MHVGAGALATRERNEFHDTTFMQALHIYWLVVEVLDLQKDVVMPGRSRDAHEVMCDGAQ